jgi:hypothetical protein
MQSAPFLPVMLLPDELPPHPPAGLGAEPERSGPPRGGEATLSTIIGRIASEVAADGRRTRPGTPNSIGPTVPFLLPHLVRPGERASLSVLASLALLPPHDRAQLDAMEGGPAVLQSATERLQRVLEELRALE